MGGIVFDLLSVWGFYRWGQEALLGSAHAFLTLEDEDVEAWLDGDLAEAFSAHVDSPSRAAASSTATAAAPSLQVAGGVTMNMRSAFLHVGADLLRSATTVVEGTAVLLLQTDGRKTDALASLVVSLTILVGALLAGLPWLREVMSWL